MMAATLTGSGPTLRDEAAALCEEPAAFFGQSHTRMQTIDPVRLAALHLEGLRHRFAELGPRIAMLGKLAARQGIQDFDTINGAVPLLFEHTMYKSYPPSLLENGRFDQINRWLSKLCTFDLTAVDVSSCEGIDDWLELMDRQTPLWIAHSSGTSGTMSFLPFSQAEWLRYGRANRVVNLGEFGAEGEVQDDPGLHCIYPFYRKGGAAQLRVLDTHVACLIGSEDRLVTAFPGRMSSDVMYLAGRLRAAKARGELDKVKVSPALLERQKEFDRLQAQMPQHMERFFDRVIAELQGKRIYLPGTWNVLYGMAERGLEKGLEGVFAPNSIIAVGGGTKGASPPANWREEVCRFVGVKGLRTAYAMTEVLGAHFMCEHGHYHFAPWIVPFCLDPDTSEPLPREGTTTGRAAFFDLGASSHWGGFITGDEITVEWTRPCGCGRTSAYITGEIRRYSEVRGGDDKISCAATEDAHREAMEFLADI